MLHVVSHIAIGMLALALLIAFARLVLGPRLEDRVVAMDLISVVAVGIIIASTAGTGQRNLLDAASLIALVGFMGTVAYAWYAQKERLR